MLIIKRVLKRYIDSFESIFSVFYAVPVPPVVIIHCPLHLNSVQHIRLLHFDGKVMKNIIQRVSCLKLEKLGYYTWEIFQSRLRIILELVCRISLLIYSPQKYGKKKYRKKRKKISVPNKLTEHLSQSKHRILLEHPLNSLAAESAWLSVFLTEISLVCRLCALTARV